MTKATHEALVQVDRVLHEAGWDEIETSDDSAMELSEMEHQLERLAVTPYWPDLCRAIREYYRRAYQNIEEGPR